MSPPDPKRGIRLYFGFQFFFTLLFWVPIFYEYQRRIGLTPAEILGIQSLYYLWFCVLEIPTGLMADQIGHRRSLRLGALVLIGANLFPIFVPSYQGFLMHFACIALARSFVSGASSAYLYNFLEDLKSPEAYKEIEGKARANALAGKMLGWSVVGYLMQLHLTLPYWLTVASSVLALGFALALPEGGGRPNRAPVFERLRDTGSILARTPGLTLAILQGVAIFVLVRILQVNLYQPILESKSIPLTWYGPVMAAMTFFEAFGSRHPGWIRKYLNDRGALSFWTTWIALVLIAIPFAPGPWVLGLLGVFSFSAGMAFPTQKQLLNDQIPDSSLRATILSVESIVDRAANAFAASLIAGYLARGELNRYLTLSSAWTIAATWILWVLARRLGPSSPAGEASED